MDIAHFDFQLINWWIFFSIFLSIATYNLPPFFVPYVFSCFEYVPKNEVSITQLNGTMVIQVQTVEEFLDCFQKQLSILHSYQ